MHAPLPPHRVKATGIRSKRDREIGEKGEGTMDDAIFKFRSTTSKPLASYAIAPRVVVLVCNHFKAFDGGGPLMAVE